MKEEVEADLTQRAAASGATLHTSSLGQLGKCIQLIQAAGLGAVFEGIETREQAQFLRSLGELSGQGFYFSKPLPEPDITALLRSRSALPLGQDDVLSGGQDNDGTAGCDS